MTRDSMPPFHLAFPVIDLEATRSFYEETIGCKIGRTSERWIDFDFFGHQVTAHRVENMPDVKTNPVDGKEVPSSHFGAVLQWDRWHCLRDHFQSQGLDFLIGPYIRFEGQPGEQATMFVLDPSGNGLEFKSFKSPEQLFATE